VLRLIDALNTESRQERLGQAHVFLFFGLPAFLTSRIASKPEKHDVSLSGT